MPIGGFVTDDPALADELAGRGWSITEERVLVLTPDAEAPVARSRVRAVTSEAMHELWAASWHRDLPDASAEVVAQLLGRETLADAVVRIVDLASFDADGRIVAGTQLRIDGATAVIEAVMTEPGAQGHGHAGSASSARPSAGPAPPGATWCG